MKMHHSTEGVYLSILYRSPKLLSLFPTCSFLAPCYLCLLSSLLLLFPFLSFSLSPCSRYVSLFQQPYPIPSLYPTCPFLSINSSCLPSIFLPTFLSLRQLIPHRSYYVSLSTTLSFTFTLSHLSFPIQKKNKIK